MGIRIAVLGGVRVWLDDVDATPSGRLPRMLVAALAVRGDGLSGPELCEILWGDRDQDSRLHLLVHRTRAALGRADLIERSGDGYRLPTGASVDIEEATAAAEDDPLRVLNDTAREPFAGLVGAFFDDQRRAAADRVSLARRAALIAALAHGEDALVLQHIAAARGESPYDEELAAVHLTALSRTGRNAEALTEYDVLRHRLADDLGADPGEVLQQLHLRLLGGGLAQSSAPGHVAVPAQLPAHLRAIVGRDAESGALDGLIDAPTGAAPRVAVISGMGGVGKTTLALSWASRRREAFDDGILFADLRGYSSTPPAEPEEVLRRFLRALGHRAGAAREEDELAAQLRSVTAGRRMLIVLDNAHSEAQVRPLLTGAEGPVVVVTSRETLLGLEVRAPVLPVALEPLEPAAAAMLAEGNLGGSEEPADGRLATRVAQRCGGLPLAIVVAARATDGAQGFDDERPVLPRLQTGDDDTDVGRVLSWSLDGLDDEARRVFRLLGMLTSPMTPSAIIALAGGDPVDAERAVRRLRRAHLLAAVDDERLEQHDLVRELAVQDLRTLDPEEISRARSRLLEHYALAVDAAVDALNADKDVSYSAVLDARSALPSRLPAQARPAPMPDAEQAGAWLDRERQTLVEVVRGADAVDDETVIRVLLRLRANAVGDGYLRQAAALFGELLRRCERAGDLAAQSSALRLMAGVDMNIAGLSSARSRLQTALQLSRRVGDEVGACVCLNNLGEIARLGGELEEAEHHFRAALAIARRRGEATRVALHLANIGLCRLAADAPEAAEGLADEAIAVAEPAGAERGRAVALRVRADARLQQGRLSEAIDDARMAMESSTRIAYKEGVARLHVLILRLRHAEGETEAARSGLAELAVDLGSDGFRWEQREALLALARLQRADGADPGPAEREAEILRRRLTRAAPAAPTAPVSTVASP